MASAERRHVRARLDSLLEKASTDVLLQTERFLNGKVEQAAVARNPSGSKATDAWHSLDGRGGMAIYRSLKLGSALGRMCLPSGDSR